MMARVKNPDVEVQRWRGYTLVGGSKASWMYHLIFLLHVKRFKLVYPGTQNVYYRTQKELFTSPV